jgi:hypothetical protein
MRNKRGFVFAFFVMMGREEMLLAPIIGVLFFLTG